MIHIDKREEGHAVYATPRSTYLGTPRKRPMVVKFCGEGGEVVVGTESSAMMLLLLHRSPAVRQARGCPERNVWNVASTYSCLGTCRPSVVCRCAQFTMRFTGCLYVRSVVRSIQVIHQRHFQPQPQRARRDIYSQIELAGLLRATLKQEKSRFHRPPRSQ